MNNNYDRVQIRKKCLKIFLNLLIELLIHCLDLKSVCTYLSLLYLSIIYLHTIYIISVLQI